MISMKSVRGVKMFECVLLPDSGPDSEQPAPAQQPQPFKGTPEDLSRAFLEKQKLAYHETRANASGTSWQTDPGSSKGPLIGVKQEKTLVSLGSLKAFPPPDETPSTSLKSDDLDESQDSQENSSEAPAEDTLGNLEATNETPEGNTKHIEHYAASFVDTWPVKNKYLDRSSHPKRTQQKSSPNISSEATFTCENCSKTFIRKYNYDRHITKCRPESKKQNEGRPVSKSKSRPEPKTFKVGQRSSNRFILPKNDDLEIMKVVPSIKISKNSLKQKQISKIPKRRSLKNSGQFIKNTEGLYQCKTCLQIVQLQIEFEVHLNCGNKDGKSKYTCMVCGIKTKSKLEVQDHMVTEHCTVDSESETENAPLYFCHECDFNCSLKVVLDAHLAIHTAFKLKCKYCEINLMNKSQYDRHLMISHDNEVSQDVPSENEREEEDAKDEMNIDIDETRLLEPECKLEASDDHFNDSTFRDDDNNSDNDSLPGKDDQEHAWQTVHIDSVLCSICNTTFPHIYKLYDHTEAEHRDHFHELRFVNKSKKKHAVKCDECKATFGFRTTLILHKLRHRGISPYVCKYCPSNFTSSSGLSHHCNRFHIKELEAESILRDPVVSKKGRKKLRDSETENNESTESPKNTKSRENPDMILSQNQSVTESTIITLCTVCKTVFPNVVALYQHCTEFHVNLKVIPVVRGNSNKPYGPFRCQDCNAGFMKMEDLRQHMIRHFDMKPFMCRACGNLYVSRSAAGYHYTTIHGPNCSRIRRSYNVPTMAEKHRLKLFNESNNFTCDFCHISFGKLKQLKDHIDQFHLLQQTENPMPGLLPMMAQHNLVPNMVPQNLMPPMDPNMMDHHHNYQEFQNHEDDETEKFMVETCRKRVIRYDTPPVNSSKKRKSDSTSQDPPDKNKSENKLTCNICDKTFAHVHHLKKHIMKLHFTEKHPEFKSIIGTPKKKVIKKLTCHLCLYIFPSKSKMRSHIMEHFNIPFKCKICREMMPYRQQLENHICDERMYPHKCYTCNRVFHEKVKLLRHQSRHVRSFPCDVCGKYFRFRNTLKRHKETIHEQVKKYLCPECGEVFGFSNQLDRHLQCHKQMKHACDSCPRKFWDLGQLQHHRNMEHREKRFICEICGRALSQKWHYNDHMRRHAGPLPRDFQCKECNLAYSSRNALHYHNKTRHPERVVKRN